VLRAAINLARPAALLLVAAVATACVGTAGAAVPSATPAPDPDRVVFRVDWDGGFVPPGVVLGRLPQVVVFADGRVVVQGPQVEIYPGPLMPNLQVRTLTPDALARLVELAKDNDLLRDAHYDVVGIADATTTVLTINLDGTIHTVSAYALAEAGMDDIGGDGTMDEATREGRAALRAFVGALTGLPEADFADAWAPFRPAALRIFTSAAVADPELPQAPVAWPLGDLALAGQPVGDGSLGFRCLAVSGDDLATLLPVLGAANALTPFTSGGASFHLVVRPLLPGESGC
jgi:hypothetical protein